MFRRRELRSLWNKTVISIFQTGLGAGDPDKQDKGSTRR